MKSRLLAISVFIFIGLTSQTINASEPSKKEYERDFQEYVLRMMQAPTEATMDKIYNEALRKFPKEHSFLSSERQRSLPKVIGREKELTQSLTKYLAEVSNAQSLEQLESYYSNAYRYRYDQESQKKIESAYGYRKTVLEIEQRDRAREKKLREDIEENRRRQQESSDRERQYREQSTMMNSSMMNYADQIQQTNVQDLFPTLPRTGPIYAYQILGVGKNATKDDINVAYRKLSVQLHPDKNKHPNANEAFRILRNARDEMIKPYDR